MGSIREQRAFTLVELSIVLVILGLLIGGVLTGQSLIRAAELRSVTTQFNKYVTATQTFRDKYFAIPGDMTNAQSYWGIAHATPATCVTTASTDSKTCNGDGNGQINPVTSSANESFRYWQHLANAGLIEGSYSGIAVGSSQGTTAANAPIGKLTSSIWFAQYIGPTANATPWWFDGDNGNALLFGTLYANGWPAIGVMRPEEAYNIDMKIDDGKPATGKTVATGTSTYTGSATSCTDASASNTLSANYKLTNTSPSCAIMFRQLF